VFGEERLCCSGATKRETTYVRKTIIMPRIKNHRPSAAMVVSLIALFVALGGTGYAALLLPKNSVGSGQVINGSLQKADLAKATVSALKGNVGRQGAQGPAGPQGAPGAAGAAGTAGTAGPAGPAGVAGATGPVGATGPQGPSGPQGIPGIQGEPGPVGPSSAMSNYTNTSGLRIDTTKTTIDSLTLSAGSYVVMGATTVTNSAANENAVCTLDDSVAGELDKRFTSTSTTTDSGSLSLLAPLTTTGSTVKFDCTGGQTFTSVFNTHLMAIKLGSVTGT
jgi:hypothetical protein